MEHSIDPIEVLEELPSYTGKREVRDIERAYRRSDFPYKKARKWCLSKIGEHFDEVFSEWCSLVWIPAQYRTLLSFHRIVEKVFKGNDGELYDESGWKVSNYSSRYTGALYLDPDTKIIKNLKTPKGKSWLQQIEEKRKEINIIIGDYHQLVKFNGIWFELKFRPLDIPDRHWFPRIFTTQTPYDPRFNDLIISKKQLSSSELKKHNLKNTPL